jgi:hypothetical protein
MKTCHLHSITSITTICIFIHILNISPFCLLSLPSVPLVQALFVKPNNVFQNKQQSHVKNNRSLPSCWGVLSPSLSTPSSSSSHSILLPSNTRLYAAPQKRVARRDLKKRPNRRGRRSGNSLTNSEATTKKTNEKQPQGEEIIESEIRPLVRAAKVEAGEDYWIDEADLQKSLQRKIALKNRKLNEGEISKEKLKTEVVAPYKQNWIGLFSVGVIILATIVTSFPELLNTPVIQIPDL